MEWILDNFQIVIALAAAVAYWLNNLRQPKEEERRDAGQEPREDYFGPDFDFGQPEEETRQAPVPPPLVRPFAAAPAIAPPPLPTAAEAELERQQQMMDRLKLLREARDRAPDGAAATKARVAAKRTAPGAATAPAMPGLRSRLRSGPALRQAIVEKEILGPPVSLRRQGF